MAGEPQTGTGDQEHLADEPVQAGPASLAELVRTPRVVTAAEVVVQELAAQAGSGPWMIVCTGNGEVLASTAPIVSLRVEGWEEGCLAVVPVGEDSPLAVVSLGRLIKRDGKVVVASARLAARMLGELVAAEQRAANAAARAGQAEALASTDRLTGLANQRGWWDRVGAEQARVDRSASPTAVVVVDLDGLKEVNDQNGHLAGDLLLRLAGETLAGAVRECDVVARIGGDEFAVLAVDCDCDDETLTRRLTDALASAGIAASVGVARHEHGTSLLATFASADQRMYLDKRSRHVGPASGSAG